MLHPYQQLARSESPSDQIFLLVALGSKLIVSSSDGEVVAQWTSSTPETSQASHANGDSDDRPAKKQKLASAETTNSGFITKLTTAAGSSAVVVVLEDKSLVVLDIADNGAITESSRRPMPKRPSAVQMIVASETILCADKFGDVYSLPLYPKLEDDLDFAQKHADQRTPDASTFKPSASTLTVHSKRNRMALESQQKQTNFTPRKAPLAFVHQLLLGHVSMLTDMIYAHNGAAPESRRIITADRDEHIRVSRAPPQAHIIEGYCLGHEEFVSKLCLIERTTLLVSGGGDDWLGLWDWSTFDLKHKIYLRQPLEESGLLRPEEKLSVSQLWDLSVHDNENHAVLVAGCERIAALIVVTISTTGKTVPTVDILTVPGSPLSMASWTNGYVFSVDARQAEQPRLQHFKTRIEDGKATLSPGVDVLTDKLNAITDVEAQPAAIDSLLHTTASLRKRRGWGEPEDEQTPQEDAE